jgi:hypothetical protein
MFTSCIARCLKISWPKVAFNPPGGRPLPTKEALPRHLAILQRWVIEERLRAITAHQFDAAIYSTVQPARSTRGHSAFPAFRKIVSLHEFDSLGEDFEKKENELSARTDLKRLWNKWPESRSASVFTNSRSSPQKFSARCALSLA